MNLFRMSGYNVTTMSANGLENPFLLVDCYIIRASPIKLPVKAFHNDNGSTNNQS